MELIQEIYTKVYLNRGQYLFEFKSSRHLHEFNRYIYQNSNNLITKRIGLNLEITLIK